MMTDAPPLVLCPICKRTQATQTYRPFCSKKCQQIDLMHWLDGDYSVPASDAPDDFTDIPTSAENEDGEDTIN